MKAIRIHSFGGREVLVHEDVPVPGITDDEILIRVHAAGVNPVDYKTCEGMMEPIHAHSLPLVPGWDVSGTVERAGAATTGFAEGDGVYAMANLAGPGTYAEFAAVKATDAAIKPASIDHEAAAAVPLVALTAWQVLFGAAALEGGQTVLIHAAAGGVGGLAVQLAKWKGARVIGTASAANRDYVLDLGADQVIDYTAVPFEQEASGVDVVLDCMGGDVRSRSWGVLGEGGILVAIVGPPPQEEGEAQGARAAMVLVEGDGGTLAEIAGLIDAGTIRPTLGTVLPLAEAARAHEMSATHHTRGKIVLKVME